MKQGGRSGIACFKDLPIGYWYCRGYLVESFTPTLFNGIIPCRYHITGECILERFISHAEVSGAGAVTATYEIMREEPTLCLTSTVDSRAVRSEKLLERSNGYNIMGKGVIDLRGLLDDSNARITATGIGCTLFAREALDHIKFRVDRKISDRAFSDTFVFTDIQKIGLKVLIDSDVICEHRK